jgi:putative transposase
MRRRKSPLVITLTEEERAQLRHLVRSTTAENGLATRARLVLLFADGSSISEISRFLFLQRRHVRTWLQRFAERRLDGLHDLPRSGRPPVFSPGGRDAPRQARLREA